MEEYIVYARIDKYEDGILIDELFKKSYIVTTSTKKAENKALKAFKRRMQKTDTVEILGVVNTNDM